MIIPISKQILDNFNLINQQYLVDQAFYNEASGVQEYRLYSYLSLFFNNIDILEIGTFDGRSAVALSHNESNNVLSYDIVDHINDKDHVIYSKPNIKFNIKNILIDLNESFIKNTKIIMIDIDHYGHNEEIIINKLRELNYSGIIILDDITNHNDPIINECMNKLWDSIPETKYDFIKYGHWSGTGIIVMNYDIKFMFLD